jgi:hypothetical protein
MVIACALEKGRLPFCYVFSQNVEGQQVFQHKLQNLAGNREESSGFHEILREIVM